ncbi:hypothetical protein B0T10DRAFT_404784 [Thelonectria olida]|uniref:DUF6536 domain-containing protein n=1 Tax=Thelonectria olida TaxID=1576542 RepID=A0A9P8W7G6_9HYPO|nr:hypothetical protein B0T10DRAFT_404784 [Thelonectria olida]
MGPPNADVEIEQIENQPQSKAKSGWRVSLIGGAIASLVVLIINLAITLWSINLPTGVFEVSDTGRRVLFEGSCSTSRRLNTLLHLLINILSSILLAASSYGMQCLSAPTRAEVDKAHRAQKWMDIGILSVRNLRLISWQRSIPWIVLMLSSLPLHLLYNSMVYASLSTVNYYVYNVDERARWSPASSIIDGQGATELFELAREENWERLTPLECINGYATGFQTSRRDVLLVCGEGFESDQKDAYSKTYVTSGTVGSAPNSSCGESPFEWVCPNSGCSPCQDLLPAVRKQADDWKPFGYRVKYCLSQPVRQLCRINLSMPIAITIVCANALKTVVLMYAAFHPPKEPLFVLGDAVKSFLQTPDVFSRDMCLASADKIKWLGIQDCAGPEFSSLKRRRWAAAASWRRWSMGCLLYCLALGVAAFFLVWGVNTLGSPGIRTLWNMGFGAASDATLIVLKTNYGGYSKQEKEILTSIFMANAPQLFFSVLYFQYNGLFTCMLSAKEWSDFGRERKSIRVSSKPLGEQRSRYFLQLPYRFSVPLLLLSILIHWMLSQSIFLVAVEKLINEDDNYQLLEWAFATCGYSPIAIMFVILASFIMVLWVGITACLKLPTPIPLVGGCSLAIAAACHHPDGAAQLNAPLVPLQWGVMGNSEPQEESGYRHCGFSSEEVDEL